MINRRFSATIMRILGVLVEVVNVALVVVVGKLYMWSHGSYSHSEAFFVGGQGGVRIVEVEAVPVMTPPARRARA